MKLKIALVLALLASPAVAQTAPSSDEIVAQYYAETGQLRSALGDAQRQINALKKQLATTAAKESAPVPTSDK